MTTKWIFITILLLGINVKAQSTDKIDIDDLEKKYWSAKDDDFTVIQNKAFTKANRFFLSAGLGNQINDTYTVGNITSFNAGYFITENYGVQITYDKSSLKNSDNTQAFIDGFGTIPDYNVFKSATTLAGVWSPFYGKMSFMEKKIVYFDLDFSLGLGQTNYEQQSSKGPNIASASHIEFKLTQQFFLNNHLAIRFDFVNQWSQQERLKYHLPSNSTQPLSLGTDPYQNTFLQLGVTFFK